MKDLARWYRQACVLCVLLLLAIDASAQQLPDPQQWNFWARDAGRGLAQRDDTLPDAWQPCIVVTHEGERDWAWQPSISIPVRRGDILELSAEIKVQGDGDAGPSFTIRDRNNRITDYAASYDSVPANVGFQAVHARVVIGPDAALAEPRFIGVGKSKVWISKPRFRRLGNIAGRIRDVPGELRLDNPSITVAFRPDRLAFTVRDKSTGNTWQQRISQTQLATLSASSDRRHIRADILDVEDDRIIRMDASLHDTQGEMLITLTSQGTMTRQLHFPAPFASSAGQYLIVPLNEGISYPADDPSIPRTILPTYGGPFLSMPFAGVTDGSSGYMAIIETPDDALIQLTRPAELGSISPIWDSQKGQFGYPRRIRYVFLDTGAHVAMAKRYRQYARETGLLKTFSDKRAQRPQIDKLIGSASVWYFEKDALEMAREMQEAGLKRMLWGFKQSPEVVKQMNDMGILTGAYDVYAYVYDPAVLPLAVINPAPWNNQAYPGDVVIAANGKPLPGWELERKDGRGRIAGNMVCDLRQPAIAVRNIANDLRDHPYQARFVDVAAATAFLECYHSDHPMTRTQSREARLDLLSIVSDRHKLVCGSETGCDAMAPAADYFEGMMSLFPYRIPDSGRNMQKIQTTVPPDLAKFQVGEKYRLPLWELVYHDACVAYWYWGDYNNKLPAIWRKRDLFNALYGTPPMYMLERKQWETDRAKFIGSYGTSTPVARATGYSEMTDHRLLTPDRSVQQTTFANGVRVTANFSQSPYPYPGGSIPPMDIRIEGLPGR